MRAAKFSVANRGVVADVRVTHSRAIEGVAIPASAGPSQRRNRRLNTGVFFEYGRNFLRKLASAIFAAEPLFFFALDGHFSRLMDMVSSKRVGVTGPRAGNARAG